MVKELGISKSTIIFKTNLCKLVGKYRRLKNLFSLTYQKNLKKSGIKVLH